MALGMDLCGPCGENSCSGCTVSAENERFREEAGAQAMRRRSERNALRHGLDSQGGCNCRLGAWQLDRRWPSAIDRLSSLPIPLHIGRFSCPRHFVRYGKRSCLCGYLWLVRCSNPHVPVNPQKHAAQNQRPVLRNMKSFPLPRRWNRQHWPQDSHLMHLPMSITY